MRRVRRVFAFGAAMLLALSAAACVGRTGESASSAAGSAGQEQAAVPQISGTVLAASRQSLVLRTPAGEDTMFYTENLQAAELAEGEWVDIAYSLPQAAAISGLSQYELLTLLGRRFTR